MTRKDYILIAVALRDTLLIDCPTKDYLRGATAAHISACNRVANALARDNPRFDRERFLKACGCRHDGLRWLDMCLAARREWQLTHDAAALNYKQVQS